MGELTKLPNVGKEVEQRLELAGITTAKELIALGTENAFIRLKTGTTGVYENA
ncbi:MAG: TfoX/Sxy family DNA transformation protein [Bacteroidales bacterium]|nr:TfoX/Sxy family DNA transformation protein [Bacteroidales bacterium]